MMNGSNFFPVVAVFEGESEPTFLGAGDEVWDDLTGAPVKIRRIEHDAHGNTAVWLDSCFLEGGRFPWEISLPFDRFERSAFISFATEDQLDPEPTEIEREACASCEAGL